MAGVGDRGDPPRGGRDPDPRPVLPRPRRARGRGGCNRSGGARPGLAPARRLRRVGGRVARHPPADRARAPEDAAKAQAEGKTPQSAEIVAKRIDGSVQKFLKEVSLLNQPFVKNDKQSIEQMLKAANTTVKSFTMYVVGEGIEKKQDDFAAEVAAQVAAAKQA